MKVIDFKVFKYVVELCASFVFIFVCSLSVIIPGYGLNNVIDSRHSFAVNISELNIELSLKPDEHLAHIESIEANLLKGTVECDCCWVFTVFVEAHEPDNSLSDSVRVSIVFTLFTRHKHVVFVVVPHWGQSNESAGCNQI